MAAACFSLRVIERMKGYTVRAETLASNRMKWSITMSKRLLLLGFICKVGKENENWEGKVSGGISRESFIREMFSVSINEFLMSSFIRVECDTRMIQ